MLINRYISDLHFGHEGVIRFDNRPFSNIEEMEEILIKNWNNVVNKNDITYILGDFCWKKEDEWKRILKLLKGNKVLIQGNHDPKNMSTELKKMFQDIKPYKEIVDKNRHVIMSHYPILFYRNSFNPNYYMLCGHVHSTQESDFLDKWKEELKESGSQGKIINVGCMKQWMNYTPRTLDELTYTLT